MNRIIKKVAILGSGVMGSRIACHFANIGCEVLLLDIVPKELTETEKNKGQSLEDASVRNRIVNEALTFALQSNPSPIYRKFYETKFSWKVFFYSQVLFYQRCYYFFSAIENCL